MKLIIATSNKGKMAEFEAALKEHFEEIHPMSFLGISCDINESGETFMQNAEIKAHFVFDRLPKGSEYAVLADDSGLCVNSLGGKPGIHSARFAGEHATDAQNRQLLLSKLKNCTDRSAYFCTALYMILPNGESITATGTTTGKITEYEIGEGGFGYDSVFYSDMLNQTFAQAGINLKNTVSHRGMALKNLSQKLNQCGINIE